MRLAALLSLIAGATFVACTSALEPDFGGGVVSPTPSGTGTTPSPTPTATVISGAYKPNACFPIGSTDGMGRPLLLGAAPAGLIADGTRVLLWQVQATGAVSGDQTVIAAALDASGAGIHEIAEVTAIAVESAVDLRLTLAVTPLKTQYRTTSAATAQACVVPVFRNVTFSAAAITGDAWNGATGGVVVFVASTAALGNSSISVDGLGFRGGVADVDPSATCDAVVFSTTDPSSGAEKGEGMDVESLVFRGRGNLWNGAGGGNGCHGGGGGGSNGGEGGSGGAQGAGSGGCTPGADDGKGYGGASITASPVSVLSFGGGGGAGQGAGGSGGFMNSEYSDLQFCCKGNK